jgi:hypothetical protein
MAQQATSQRFFLLTKKAENTSNKLIISQTHTTPSDQNELENMLIAEIKKATPKTETMKRVFSIWKIN